MARKIFYFVTVFTFLVIAYISNIDSRNAYWFIAWGVYMLLGVYDLCQTRHNILRNYPVIGHIRYAFEFIRPEIQQYFVATNLSGRPYNRESRDAIYLRASNLQDDIPFGTQHDITDVGYDSLLHSMHPTPMPEQEKRVTIGGPNCLKPYSASHLNISAMSFGALGARAVMALNEGAKRAGCYQNTGEGGLSEYHLSGGGDIVMQLGTGYFGCRKQNGRFDESIFQEKAALDVVKMIEIKISQGAKPATGGLLPGAKVSAEIAKTRGVPEGEECISPKAHPEFSTPIELLEFVKKLRQLSGGKPVGFKLCLGIRREFMAVVKAMLETGIVPDFITIDGAEGGTGAAPIEYTDRIGTTLHDAIAFVHSVLVGANLRQDIRLIVSGKIVTGFDMALAFALGGDLCNMARPMLFSLGCIQAIRCNTNTCPTGITTQNKRRQRALHVDKKSVRVANFHRNTVVAFHSMLSALGVSSVDALTPDLFFRRIADEVKRPFSDIYPFLTPGALLGDNVHSHYAKDWQSASAKTFGVVD